MFKDLAEVVNERSFQTRGQKRIFLNARESTKKICGKPFVNLHSYHAINLYESAHGCSEIGQKWS